MTDRARLAINGGAPVRTQPLPYGHQSIDETDIHALVEVLKSDWLTTGPTVPAFESALAEYLGAGHAVAVANGTAALHAAVHAAEIGPGDEVLVPAMTFAASANAVVYEGGTPVFVDVEAETLLIDVAQLEQRITPRTKAIVTVDYAGQPCNYEVLIPLANKHNLILIADACHALGADYQERKVGTLGDLSTFSFHPVKPITTGEGGLIATDNERLAQKMRVFRNHGITTDHRQRAEVGSWFYEMTDLGYNYRLSDLQCALGLNQLRRLNDWTIRRQAIAHIYDEAFAGEPAVQPLTKYADRSHAYHLYVIRLNLERLTADRSAIFAALRAEGIGANVHYIPVHLHPYYRQNFKTGPGLCPNAESAYERILSLPIFPGMTDRDARDVISAIEKVLSNFKR
jgi:perosamine synthetase